MLSVPFVGMRRQDYFLQGTRGWLRLHEKGGKRHDVPAHHRAEAAVEAYLAAGGVEDATLAEVDAALRQRELFGAAEHPAQRGGRDGRGVDVSTAAATTSST